MRDIAEMGMRYMEDLRDEGRRRWGDEGYRGNEG